MKDFFQSIPDFFRGFNRNPYLVSFNCPDDPDEIKRILDAAGKAGAGTVGDYTRVAMIIKGEETWRSGENAHPTIGAPGEISVEPSVRISMQTSRRSLREVVGAIAAAHSYEEPVIEVTALKRRGLVASAVAKTAKTKAGHK